MSEVIGAILLVAGNAFLLLAAIGIVRMPDLFTRMQAGTKASTLGVALVLVSLAVRFDDIQTQSLALAGVAFFFLTAPVAAHMISRAAYFVGVPLWEHTIVDEWHGRPELMQRTKEIEKAPLDEIAMAEDQMARRSRESEGDQHA